MTDVDDALLSGGYDPDGAYGPTVVMQLASADAAAWLRELFLTTAESGGRTQLADQPGVRLRDLGNIELGLATAESDKEFVKIGDGPAFAWLCSRERWLRNAGLLEPFVAGQTGHQYMTSETYDDALVEISLGEVHPGL